MIINITSTNDVKYGFTPVCIQRFVAHVDGMTNVLQSNIIWPPQL